MRVPAERELAAALDVSRTTVAAAYEALREAGILHSRRGAGSWTQLPPGIAASASARPSPPRRPHPLRPRARLPRPPGRPSCARRRPWPSRTSTPTSRATGTTCSGLPALRAAIARRFTARACPPRADQVLVTAAGRPRSRSCRRPLTPGDGCSSSTRPTRTRSTPCTRAGAVCPGAPRPRLRRSRGVGPGPGDRSHARRCPTAGLPGARPPEPDRALLDGAGRERLVAWRAAPAHPC